MCCSYLLYFHPDWTRHNVFLFAAFKGEPARHEDVVLRRSGQLRRGHHKRTARQVFRVCLHIDHAHIRRSHHFGDRKSTRLNSSHSQISYAVFCLKKKIETITTRSHSTTSPTLLSRASLPLLYEADACIT